MNCIRNFPEYWRKKRPYWKFVLLEVIFFSLVVSWKVDQTVSLPFPKWMCFMGKNRILAAFSSSTTKSVMLQPFRENSCSNQFIFRMICCTYTFFCSCSSRMQIQRGEFSVFNWMCQVVEIMFQNQHYILQMCQTLCSRLFKTNVFFSIYLFILSVYTSHRW